MTTQQGSADGYTLLPTKAAGVAINQYLFSKMACN